MRENPRGQLKLVAYTASGLEKDVFIIFIISFFLGAGAGEYRISGPRVLWLLQLGTYGMKSSMAWGFISLRSMYPAPDPAALPGARMED